MITSDESAPRKGLHNIHVVGAFALGVAMMVLLYLIPLTGHERHMRRLELIQTGAATDLRLVATQEAKFFHEHGYYTTDFNQLGIVPKAVVYKIGFVRAGAPHPGTDPTIKDLDVLKARFPKLDIAYSVENKLDKIDLSSLDSACSNCTADDLHFRAIAAAHLGGDEALDLWTIDENGSIVHLENQH